MRALPLLALLLLVPLAHATNEGSVVWEYYAGATYRNVHEGGWWAISCTPGGCAVGMWIPQELGAEVVRVDVVADDVVLEDVTMNWQALDNVTWEPCGQGTATTHFTFDLTGTCTSLYVDVGERHPGIANAGGATAGEIAFTWRTVESA